MLEDVLFFTVRLMVIKLSQPMALGMVSPYTPGTVEQDAAWAGELVTHQFGKVGRCGQAVR